MHTIYPRPHFFVVVDQNLIQHLGDRRMIGQNTLSEPATNKQNVTKIGIQRITC